MDGMSTSIFHKTLFSITAPHNGGKRFVRRAVQHLLGPIPHHHIKVRDLLLEIPDSIVCGPPERLEIAGRVEKKEYAPDAAVIAVVNAVLNFTDGQPIILESLRTPEQMKAIHKMAHDGGYRVVSMYRDLPRWKILQLKDKTKHDVVTIERSFDQWKEQEDQLVPAMISSSTPGWFFNLEGSGDEPDMKEGWYHTPADMADFFREEFRRRQLAKAA